MENELKEARASAHDVAAYILRRKGAMTAMKLQKLLYYCQAWSLVWDERPIFREHIQAWSNGPVVREVYDNHRGEFKIDVWPFGDIGVLDALALKTIDSVLGYYGNKSSRWLIDQTHIELPWKNARGDLPPEDRSYRPIRLGDMMDYYCGVVPGDPRDSLPPSDDTPKLDAFELALDDAALARHWDGAMAYLKERGHDPEAIIDNAAAAVEAWRDAPTDVPDFDIDDDEA